MTKKKPPASLSATEKAAHLSDARPMKEGKPQAGWKQCPKCKKWNKGPKTPKCYGCGNPFPARPR